MNKRSAQVNQERASVSAARKEDALELAQILYDIYVEQVKSEDVDTQQGHKDP